MDKASALIQKNPEVRAVFSVPGFGAGSAPNQGLMLVVLKPIAERSGEAHSAEAVVNSVRGPRMGIGEAMIFPTVPPPIQGLGQYGGLQFELQQTGGGSLEDLERVYGEVRPQGAKGKELAPPFPTFRSADPASLGDDDREQPKRL